MVTRLAPSHAGGNCICGALKLWVLAGATGVPAGLLATDEALVMEQAEGATPGSEVSLQHDTNPLRKK